MHAHLPKWRAYLQKLQPNRQVEKDDYIFPHIAPNGLIHPKREMSYDSLQALLTKFTTAAGLEKHYTTHCFRRGGAQYRFMYAPIGKRWPLSWIRWWGGWAVREHVSFGHGQGFGYSRKTITKVDTLMKYLIDSLQSFETGHGNALHPIPLELDKSFMGEHTAMQHATGEDVRQIQDCVNRKFDELTKTITTKLSHTCHSGTSAHGLTDPISDIVVGPERMPHTQLQASRAASAPYTLPNGTEGAAVRKESRQTSLHESATSKAGSIIAPTFQRFNFAIPDLGRTPGTWKRAITQWEEVDPVTKCTLKDWPREWYKGSSATAGKRIQRKTIFDEYVRCASQYP